MSDAINDAARLWAYWQARLTGSKPQPTTREQWDYLAEKYPHPTK